MSNAICVRVIFRDVGATTSPSRSGITRPKSARGSGGASAAGGPAAAGSAEVAGGAADAAGSVVGAAAGPSGALVASTSAAGSGATTSMGSQRTLAWTVSGSADRPPAANGIL
jgi:hypothetical protein